MAFEQYADTSEVMIVTADSPSALTEKINEILGRNMGWELQAGPYISNALVHLGEHNQMLTRKVRKGGCVELDQNLV